MRARGLDPQRRDGGNGSNREAPPERRDRNRRLLVLLHHRIDRPRIGDPRGVAAVEEHRDVRFKNAAMAEREARTRDESNRAEPLQPLDTGVIRCGPRRDGGTPLVRSAAPRSIPRRSRVRLPLR